MKKNILVVVAHADDEVLGCGGTMLKHSTTGDVVSLLVLADGVSSREGIVDKESRCDALLRSCNILGVYDYKECGFPDNKMDTIPLLEIVKTIEDYILEVSPDIIYTHSFNDLNIDHSLTHRAVMTACRPQYGSKKFPEIYSFYVPSSSEWASPSMSSQFTPNKFVNINPYYEKKIEAFMCYANEIKTYPHPRSVKGIDNVARFYGNTVGLEKAECFFVERIVEI